MSTQPTKLPTDKTPVQRAQIKLWEQFAAVFLFNAALAALVLYSSYASQQSPNWLILAVAASAQGILALFNVLEKYFSANNQPLYSAMFDAARQEVAIKAPQVAYSTTDQALQQAANAAFSPQYSSTQYSQPAYTASQSTPVPSSLSKVTLQPLPAQSTPVVASTPNVAPAGSVPLTTIPAMPVVQAQG